MKRPQNQILVIRGGAIGDFVLTLPVLAALRQQFPQSRLELLGYPHIAQLALAGGLVDAVRSIEARPLAGFFAANSTLAPDLADYFSGFALIVSYLYDPDGIFQTNVARCSKAQFIAGPHRPDESGNQHATDVLLRPLECLAIFDADPVPRLALVPRPASPEPAHDPGLLSGAEVPLTPSLSPTGGEGVRRTGEGVVPRGKARSRSTEPLLALHPGSGSERKNWPEVRWAELLQRLVASAGVNFLLVGGESEGDRLDRLAALIPADRLNLARNLPLAELAERLRRASAFVGHDSGITHLAASLGVPGLALWGDSVEAVWRPRGETMAVLREPAGLAAITVAQVFDQVMRLVREPRLEV